MISVIMSVYNAEKYLDIAIESILNQSFRNFEKLCRERLPHKVNPKRKE